MLNDDIKDENVPIQSELDDEALQNAAKQHDAHVKDALSYKRVQAFFVKYTLPEYEKCSTDEIVTEAIEPIASSIGRKGSLRNLGMTWTHLTRGGAELVPDVRFIVRHRGNGEMIITPISTSHENLSPEQIDMLESESAVPVGKYSEIIDEGNACEYVIFHIEGETTDFLTENLYNRSTVNIAADLDHQIEHTKDSYAKYHNISDVVMVWLIFSDEPSMQNRIITNSRVMKCIAPKEDDDEESSTTAVTEQKQVGKSEKGKGEKSSTFDPTLRGVYADTSDSFVVSDYNPRWHKIPLVTELFVFLGDPYQKNVKEGMPFLHGLDMLFYSSSENQPERMKTLREYGLVKEKEEETMATATADYGVTYRYFNNKMQRMQERNQQMQEQMQRERENQRRMAAFIARSIAGPDTRTKYSSYEDARKYYLDQIGPSDNFRDEALEIFQQIWDQNAP